MGPQVEAESTHVDTGGAQEVPGLGCQGDNGILVSSSSHLLKERPASALDMNCYRNRRCTCVTEPPDAHVLQDSQMHMCYRTPRYTCVTGPSDAHVLQDPQMHMCYRTPRCTCVTGPPDAHVFTGPPNAHVL